MTTTKKTPLAIGDYVRLTGKHLRNTGQYAGAAGQSVWQITGFTNGGQWATTDEPEDHPPGYYADEELAAEPSLRFRRIAVGNLERTHARRG